MSDIKTKFRLRRDIFLPWEMFESKAFSKLSASQIRTLIRFLQKREWITEGTGKKKRRIFINNVIVFTYSEARHVLGIGITQFSTNIRKLVETGFIDLEHQGGACGRDFSRFTLSDRWRNYGTPEFEAVTKKKALKKGFDIRTNMEASGKKLSQNPKPITSEK